MGYDYSDLNKDIKMLMRGSGIITKTNIGKSLMGRDIMALKAGVGDKKIVLLGGYHGLEYITSAFLMRFITDYAEGIVTESTYFGYETENLFKSVTLYVIPMVNPDGVDIAVNGLSLTNPYHRTLISLVGIQNFTSVWQANARGVDLNHNHDADWERVVDKPSPSKFGGEYPESESETKAISDFVRKNDIDILLSFHSQGREIYYDFGGFVPEGGEDLARQMAKVSGYKVAKPEGSAAFGGCKDWFINEFGRMGFTIEIGMGKNPLPMEQLDEIYEENARIILCTMSE